MRLNKILVSIVFVGLMFIGLNVWAEANNSLALINKDAIVVGYLDLTLVKESGHMNILDWIVFKDNEPKLKEVGIEKDGIKSVAFGLNIPQIKDKKDIQKYKNFDIILREYFTLVIETSYDLDLVKKTIQKESADIKELGNVTIISTDSGSVFLIPGYIIVAAKEVADKALKTVQGRLENITSVETMKKLKNSKPLNQVDTEIAFVAFNYASFPQIIKDEAHRTASFMLKMQKDFDAKKVMSFIEGYEGTYIFISFNPDDKEQLIIGFVNKFSNSNSAANTSDLLADFKAKIDTDENIKQNFDMYISNWITTQNQNDVILTFSFNISKALESIVGKREASVEEPNNLR